MRVCSFSYCYYNTPKNITKDKVEVNIKCDHCADVYYHSPFCKKIDTKHTAICRSTSKISDPLAPHPSLDDSYSFALASKNSSVADFREESSSYCEISD